MKAPQPAKQCVAVSPKGKTEAMAKRTKVIISCGVTRSIHTLTLSDALPITPDEVRTILGTKEDDAVKF